MQRVKTSRLIASSDSVMVVAVVLLVYNLAALVTTDPNAFQEEIFFHTLAAYIGSFIVVFFYWVVFTTLLEYIKDLDDVIVSLSLIFLILITLTTWKCSRRTIKKSKIIIFYSIDRNFCWLAASHHIFYVTKGKVPSTHAAERTLINVCDPVILHCHFVCIFSELHYCTIAYIFCYSTISNSKNENS